MTSSWRQPDLRRSKRGFGSRSAESQALAPVDGQLVRGGELTVDSSSYVAKLDGRLLDLTFKEFELIKFLVQHPGRAFTRDHLMRRVWGYDNVGGTRTVDVHIRRLRLKLGSEHESMIETVRQVGYRFVAPADRTLPMPTAERAHVRRGELVAAR